MGSFKIRMGDSEIRTRGKTRKAAKAKARGKAQPKAAMRFLDSRVLGFQDSNPGGPQLCEAQRFFGFQDSRIPGF
jgi:hypothetical protein